MADGEGAIWTTGRAGCEPLLAAPVEVEAVIGRGRVKLGLGDGRFTSILRRLVALGLGLLLLSCDIGEVNPLPPPPNGSSDRGATMAMASSASLSSESAVRISAALSRTVGTAWSSCSVNFPRGMRCGSEGWFSRGGDGVMGSISRSKIAEDEECLDIVLEGCEKRGSNTLTPRSAMTVLKLVSESPNDVSEGAARCALRADSPSVGWGGWYWREHGAVLDLRSSWVYLNSFKSFSSSFRHLAKIGIVPLVLSAIMAAMSS